MIFRLATLPTPYPFPPYPAAHFDYWIRPGCIREGKYPPHFFLANAQYHNALPEP